MSDKEKIRAEIERRYNERDRIGDNIRANVYKSLISFIDSMQEEPVNDDLKKAAENYAFTMSGEDEILKHDAFIEGAQWQKQKDSMPVSEELEEAVNAYIGYAPEVDECSSTYGKRQAFKAGAQWQKTKDESTIEDLGEYINELSKQFPEVSFAKLSRIGVRVAKWQRKEIYEWIRTHKDEYVYNSPYDSFDIEQCIIDLKQAMKDET